MRRTALLTLAAAALSALVVGAITATAGNDGRSMPQMPRMHHTMHTSKAATLTASDLRNTLNQLLGEHAVLAMNATNLGVTGSKAFPAAAKTLDENSVALSQAIGSLYGAKAGKTFLDGPFMWRAHVKFFVDYTVATAKRDEAAKAQAVANLKTYTVRFGDFLAGATGLPKLAVRNDLLGHVLELKTQLDDYAAHRYAKAADDYRHAYAHMFMTGDLLAGAIAQQKNLK
ncbi:MAG TPA: hypothetical protein VH305_09265 [Gaiella sp.]|jgi:hypothetical protein